MSHTLAIEGTTFSDIRGRMKFFNTFDMNEIVRFYEISPASTEIIRGWQGHLKEKKWFYCHTGAFVIQVVDIKSDQESPNNTRPEKFELRADLPLILEVPPGMATAFRAVTENSKLMVFSDFTVEESVKDDYRYPLENWEVKW